MDLGFDALALAVGAFAFFAGAAVKGITGLGMPLVAISVLAVVMPVDRAVPLMVVPAVLTNVWQLRQSWRYRAALDRVLPLAIALAAGTVVGAYFLSAADPRVLSMILGTVLVTFVATSLVDLRFTIPVRTERLTGAVAGTATGLLGGVTGVFGPTLAIYLLALRLGKNEFVWLMGMMMLTASIVLALSLTGFGALGPAEFMMSLAALGPAWLGFRAGVHVRDRVSPTVFRRAVLVLVFVMGLLHLHEGFT